MRMWNIAKTLVKEIGEDLNDKASEKLSHHLSKDTMNPRSTPQVISRVELELPPPGLVQQGLTKGASTLLKSSKKLIETAVEKYHTLPAAHDILDRESIEYIIKTLSDDKKTPIDFLIEIACNNPDTLDLAFQLDKKLKLNYAEAIKEIEMKSNEQDRVGDNGVLVKLRESIENYEDSEVSLKLDLLRQINTDDIPTYKNSEQLLNKLNENYPNWLNILAIDFILHNYLDNIDDSAKLKYAQKGLKINPTKQLYLQILKQYYPVDISELVGQVENI